MKKSLVITLVIIGVVLVSIIGLVIMGALSVSKARESLTAKEFENIMLSKDFKIIDAKDQFPNTPHLEEALIALNDNYQIEFYVLTNSEYADTMFINNQYNLEANKGDVSSYSTINFANGAKYTLSTNGKFSVITKIDNTLVYLNVDNEHKEDVKLILDEINY